MWPSVLLTDEEREEHAPEAGSRNVRHRIAVDTTLKFGGGLHKHKKTRSVQDVILAPIEKYFQRSWRGRLPQTAHVTEQVMERANIRSSEIVLNLADGA